MYGGHTIGVAFSQAVRALPNLVTVVAWRSCDHLAPVFEGDVLRSSVTVDAVDELDGAAALVELRVQTDADRVDESGSEPVLDWRLVGGDGVSDDGPGSAGGILEGFRLVEGSAFVAAPLGGMTLAQLGADVIRFDQIGGGLDYQRWPLAADGQSLFWAGLNKGKRSIQVDIRSEQGRELVTALIAAAGALLTNFPARGWLDYDAAARAPRGPADGRAHAATPTAARRSTTPSTRPPGSRGPPGRATCPSRSTACCPRGTW